MSKHKPLHEDDAWQDGWELAGMGLSRSNHLKYRKAAEREAFTAGWNARLEHIALGYPDDVPQPAKISG